MLTLEHCGLCGWEPHYDGSVTCGNTRCPQHGEYSDDVGWNEHQPKLRAFVEGLRRMAFEAGREGDELDGGLQVRYRNFDEWKAGNGGA